jgi:hypothetical protein
MTSSADKRTLFTDALETLGMIHTKQEYRDAIHLAVEPVVAGTDLFPGDHITVINGVAYRGSNTVGIVDPFIVGGIKKGDKFWLVVYPRKITSLRHVWTHPAFDDYSDAHKTKKELSENISEQWLKEYAKELGVKYEDLMNAAQRWIENDCYYMESNEDTDFYGKFESVSTHDDFWNHYQIVTGQLVDEDKKTNFFSCSC